MHTVLIPMYKKVDMNSFRSHYLPVSTATYEVFSYDSHIKIGERHFYSSYTNEDIEAKFRKLLTCSRSHRINEGIETTVNDCKSKAFST